MRARHGVITVLAMIALAASPMVAQEIRVGGQVRSRFELRDPAVSGVSKEGDGWVSMRVRAELEALLERQVRVFVQLQDVRLWGEERSTLGDFSADQLDVHQAYIDVGASGAIDLLARVGRQEISFGGHRLVGNVNWTQQARSFDAARISLTLDPVRADLFGALLSDATASTNDQNSYLLGAYTEVHRWGPGTLDLYGFLNTETGADETKQLTLGGRWWGEGGPLRFRAEASYQTGERAGADVRAFMVGARIGTTFAGTNGSVAIWYDYLSGDVDPDDDRVRVFDTLFATNHKYYGLADLFLNIPLNTDGRGLQDFALKGTYALTAEIGLAADVHSFRVAQSAGLSTGHLAEEIDLTGSYRYSENLSFQAGLSLIFPAGGLAEIGRPDQDTVWTYLMLDLSF